MKVRMSYIVKLFPAASQFLFTNFDNNELTFKRLFIIVSNHIVDASNFICTECFVFDILPFLLLQYAIII